MKQHLTERDMLDRLNIRYGVTYQNGTHVIHRYARAEHVRSSLGFGAKRTADYLALDLWGTTYGQAAKRGPHLHGHEVKVSRSDWLVELKDPDKSETFKRHMHYWWLVVADPAIVKDGELPEGWGLMSAYGAGLRVLQPAPRLTPEQMTLNQHGALLRAAQTTAARLAAAGLDPAVISSN